jgi:hypothetical protein
MIRKVILSGLILGLAMFALFVPAMAQVVPPSVDIAPGETLTVEKMVPTPPIPPKPDIYFLADTTGSMGGAIGSVQDNAQAILDAVIAAQPDAQFGVGNYKDFPYDAYAYQNQLNITADTVAVKAAIDAWAAGGGADGPEGQLYAHTLISNPGVGWRTGATKILVWFGDAPAHDPVPNAATGLGYDITEATATNALVGAGIKVVAVSLNTGWYESGLDDDPGDAGGDYAWVYGIVENGTPGQATRIANATGGVYLFAPTPEEVADKILEGLQNLPITVTPVVEGCLELGVSVQFFPPVVTVPSGDPAIFREVVTAAKDAKQCNKCVVKFIDGAGNVLGEQVIHVKDIEPPAVACTECANPAGKNVPGENRSANAKSKAVNPDGFYLLSAKDNCDPSPMLWVGTKASPKLFGPFASGTTIKLTQAPGATPSIKPMGGPTSAVPWHITLPTDAVVSSVDASGNVGVAVCLVPPPPK